jgi:hypothetical protein
MLALVVVATLVAGAAASAHHSYSATYDVSQKVTLEGKLVQFVFKNPNQTSACGCGESVQLSPAKDDTADAR